MGVPLKTSLVAPSVDSWMPWTEPGPLTGQGDVVAAFARVMGRKGATWLLRQCRADLRAGGAMHFAIPWGKPLPRWFWNALTTLRATRGWTVERGNADGVVVYRVRYKPTATRVAV